MPCRQNIQRGVMISVGFMPTGGAYELRLRDTIGLVHISANVTRLACILRRNQTQFAARPGQLVFKLAPELSPSLVENGLVQTGLGTDVPARFVTGAGRGRAHVLHLEVFHDDNRVVFADVRRGLVEEVVSRIRNHGMQLPHFGLLLSPVRGECDLAGKLALFPRQPGLMLAERIRRGEDGSVGQRGEPGDTHVDADHAGRGVSWFGNFPFRLDADMPFSGSQAYRNLFRRSLDIAALSVPYPAYLWQIDAGVSFIQSEPLRVAEGIMSAFLFEPGKIRPLLKEVDIRPIKVFERLLEDLGVGFGQEDGIVFFLPITEQPGQFVIALTLAIRLIGVFFKGKRLVPNKTTAAREPAHYGLLRGRCPKLEFIGLQPFHE